MSYPPLNWLFSKDVLDLRAAEEKGPRSTGPRDEPVEDDHCFTQSDPVRVVCTQKKDFRRQSFQDSMLSLVTPVASLV